jgi:DNA-binding MarR family transcriptional regulator
MVAKGRGCSGDEAIFRRYPELALRGADHPNAHLTAPQAAAIKVLLSSPGCPSQDVIAKQFGVSQGTITNIKRGLVWKEVVL